MTNNKHKEIIEKTLDKICEETSFIRGLDYDDEKLDYIGKCISSALTEQLEELERWVEGKQKDFANELQEGGTVHIKKLYLEEEKRAYSQGAFLCLETTLSHIREQKEEIKKV